MTHACAWECDVPPDAPGVLDGSDLAPHRPPSFLSRESVFLVDPTLPYVEVRRRPETCCSLPNQPGAVGGVTGHVGMTFKAQDPAAAP